MNTLLGGPLSLQYLPLWFIETVFVLFGLSIGSFLNVVIYRLPKGLSVVSPRSKCPRCGNMIAWYDNLPIVSFLILRAKCRHCSEKISWRYPLVEALTAVLAFLCAHYFPPAVAASLFVFCAALVAISFIDMDWRIIPDVISLPGVVVGILLGFWYQPSVIHRLIGAAFGGGILLAVAGVYYLIKRTEGMGIGDAKLLAMIGAFLGWAMVPVVLVVSSVVGSIVGILWIVIAGQDRTFRIPFGPFLALGALVALFWGWGILDLIRM